MLDNWTTEPAPCPPCVFVLFGATGDLAARKIAPAIYNLAAADLLPDSFFVLGAARRAKSDEEFRGEMLSAVEKYSRSMPVDKAVWHRMTGRWGYQVVQLESPADFVKLGERLKDIDSRHGTAGNRLFYLATVPEQFAGTADNLVAAGLNKPADGGSFVRLVVEKPFGRDFISASALNEQLSAGFDESQIFRIDHYLGKETVQNLLVLRFANAVFEPLLNRHFVDEVQITTAESAGMEGRRGAYYETAGAMRDMIQSHMLQLLASLTMENPGCLRCGDIRDRKADVLRALVPIGISNVARHTCRGQYLSGPDGPTYRQEQGVAPDSAMETFAALKVFVDLPAWRGVPFYLRTGKRLAGKSSDIIVSFKRETPDLFRFSACDARGRNRLHIRIFPNEGICLGFDAKVPGISTFLRPAKLNFDYNSSFGSASPEAYELLIHDALVGDSTMFLRADEVAASWAFIDPIRKAWDDGKPELNFYEPGTWGPDAANNLFEDQYKSWHPV